MRLPPEPVLVAARRWLGLLPTSGGVRRAQALLTSHADYSDLTPTQYAAALAWLRDLGLHDVVAPHIPPEKQILRAILEHGDLPWIRDADVLIQSPDELPTDIVAAGAVLGLRPNDVYDQVLVTWGKVDTEAREQVGAAGEAALVDLLKSCTDGKVDQVSATSDGLGYDIAVDCGPVFAHLEVKSTTRSGRLTVYLSRNEYERMLRDEAWVLVAVRLSEQLVVEATGSVPKAWIVENTPRDVGAAGSWASCKLEIPHRIVEHGIPALAGALLAPLPPW